MSVGSNIRKRRYELGMSQQELACAMGYKTRSTIAKIESGENDVSQKKLQKFSEILNIPVERLVSDNTAAPARSLLAESSLHPKDCRHIAVVLAGGKAGIQQAVPNQFIHVKGKPILVYSLEAYQKHPSIDDIYIVCLKGWETIARDYSSQFGITKLRGIITGGASGTASLEKACRHIAGLYKDNDLVIVQEATRPLIQAETISALLQSAEEKGSVTICHSMNDYVQFDVSSGQANYVDRNSIIALQSPEAHRLCLMQEVFEKARRENHALSESCCTMLMYHLGYKINFLQSSVNNIKIARTEDIAAFSAQIRD